MNVALIWNDRFSQPVLVGVVEWPPHISKEEMYDRWIKSSKYPIEFAGKIRICQSPIMKFETLRGCDNAALVPS